MDSRRVTAVGAAALALLLVAPPGAPTAPTPAGAQAAGCTSTASQQWPVVRMAGPDRYATAACVAEVVYATGVDAVVLARGDDAGGFADALAGTVLAQAVVGPVVLTRRGDLPQVTAETIQSLAPRRVVILGGAAAVSRRVANQVRALGPVVERLQGKDRAGTAAAIAAQVPGTAAFVVNGHRPADALTAGAAAARAGAVLLLSGTDGLPAATREALRGRTQVTVVGGHGVVGSAAEQALRTPSRSVTRLGGSTRYETAATVARVHPGDGTIHLVSGADGNLVDAIAAGWLAALPTGGPVIYTRPDGPDRATDRYLRLGPLVGTPETRIIGGRAAVGPGMVAALEDRYAEAAAGGPSPQLRGMWVHLFDGSLKSRAGIERVLDSAAAANLNTVVVQGARRHDAFYDSSVLPATTDPDLAPGLDMLATLIPAAHARGLQVHVWWSLMPSTHPSMVDEDLGPDHVNTRHGIGGTGQSWLAAGWTPGYEYLDPAIPGVQDHVVAVIREVVERYDVDGVHLDYLRYECLRANDNGTCQYADDDSPAATTNQNPVTMQRWQDHGAGRTLADFMRGQVTDVVRRVTVEVAEADPTVVVSAALLAQGEGPTGPDLRASFASTRPYLDKGQDWATWVEEGLVDHAYPMDYYDQSRYPDRFERWASFADALDDAGHVTALGLGNYLNCVGESLGQVARATGALDGVVLYSYQGTVDPACGQGPDALHEALVAPGGAFATPAPVPSVPRRTAPRTGWVLVEGVEDGANVTATPDGGAALTRQADATGHAGFVDLQPGTWLVRVDGGPPTTIDVRAGKVTRVKP